MRLKVKCPSTSPIFETHDTIGIGELNYGNHLGNDKVLTMAHECRLRFFKELSFDELNFFGEGLIMASAQIQYLAQGFFGDKVTLKLWLGEKSSSGFKIFNSLVGPKGEIARIEIDMVFFSYESQRVTKCPQAFLDYWEKHAL